MKANYRTDIQGLRGISVLLVVLYHTDTLFTGGFIGVDVFFVISGYVIMSSLLHEFRERSSISLKNFISRRVLRLLPASTMVVIFTLLASIFVFSPFSEQGQIARTSLSSTFFSANLYFVLQNSYSALINNPFRHMWSLGIEEQFYIFLILAIVAIIHFSQNKSSVPQKILNFALITGSISFAANLAFSAGIRILPLPTRIAFFSPLTRIWELQIGVVAAFIATMYSSKFKKSFLAEVFASTGIALIFFSALTFNSFLVFPGFLALLPTTGAFLVVLFAGNSQLIAFLLSLKPIRFLGDISYSWYLWHWPLIVFAQILAPGDQQILLLSGLLSIIPSVFSFYFIENRFRFHNKAIGNLPTKTLAISISTQIAIACLVIIGASTTYGLKLNVPAAATGSWASKNGCQMTEPIFPIEQCFVPAQDSSKTVLLIGDSQAGSISDGVKAATAALNVNFAVWYNDGCPVFPRPTLEREDCAPFLEEIPALIEKLDPDVIVVANKSTLYTTGGAQRGGLTIVNEKGGTPKNYAEAIDSWLQGLHAQFDEYPFKTKHVLLIQQVPPSKPVSPTLLNQHRTNYTFDISKNPDRNRLVGEEVLILSSLHNLSFLDPAVSICPNDSCVLVEQGNNLYSDEFHLSPFGAMQLKDQIVDSLNTLLSSP